LTNCVSDHRPTVTWHPGSPTARLSPGRVGLTGGGWHRAGISTTALPVCKPSRGGEVKWLVSNHGPFDDPDETRTLDKTRDGGHWDLKRQGKRWLIASSPILPG